MSDRNGNTNKGVALAGGALLAWLLLRGSGGRGGGGGGGALSLAPNLGSLRNGGFVYRPVGARGDDYPEWLRNLRGESGVYVIRDARSGMVLYVGESHTGRVYETLTRHFQGWRRWKGFWRGQFAEGHDPGLTYRRDRVEVAVRVTRAADALDEESRLIRRLTPRDNLLGQAELEPAPF